MNKILIILISVLIVVGGGWFLERKYFKSSKSPDNSQDQIKEITFYYLPTCSWCQKTEADGTIEKIERFGIKVNKINAATGPIRHEFKGVPTFVIDGKVYTGYRTFEEIRELLNLPAGNDSTISEPIEEEINFIGEKGENTILENGTVKIAAAVFNDNRARFYNVEMPDGKIIYYFVVKDKNGVYRAAANSCQVCFSTGKGFRQEGDEIVCNNCGNRYPVEKIATEKGGCNPGPIDPDLKIEGGMIIIKQANLEQVSDLF